MPKKIQTNYKQMNEKISRLLTLMFFRNGKEGFELGLFGRLFWKIDIFQVGQVFPGLEGSSKHLVGRQLLFGRRLGRFFGNPFLLGRGRSKVGIHKVAVSEMRRDKVVVGWDSRR